MPLISSSEAVFTFDSPSSSYTKNKDKGIIEEVVKTSCCLPAAIKYITNEINRNGLYDSSSWLIETLKMRESLKNKFFELCILTIADHYISHDNINKILSGGELIYFLNSSSHSSP